MFLSFTTDATLFTVYKNFYRCCSRTILLLEFALGTGGANMRVRRVTMRPTPSQARRPTLTPAQCDSMAVSIYRGVSTFKAMRWCRSCTRPRMPPDNRELKYREVARAEHAVVASTTVCTRLVGRRRWWVLCLLSGRLVVVLALVGRRVG
jgi:hypothetical protein